MTSAVTAQMMVSYSNASAIDIIVEGDSTPTFDDDGDDEQTLSYAVPVATDFLVVVVFMLSTDSTDPTVSSVTWNGSACTLSVTGLSGSYLGVIFWRYAMYWIAAPTTGTHDAVVTWSGDVAISMVHAVALSGVKQTSPVDTSNGSTVLGSDNVSISTTVVTAPTIRIGCRFISGTAPFTYGSGVTELGQADDPLEIVYGSGYHIDASLGPFDFDIANDDGSDAILEMMQVVAFKQA